MNDEKINLYAAIKAQEAAFAESHKKMAEMAIHIENESGTRGINNKLKYLTEFLIESARVSDRATKENLNLQIKVAGLTERMHTLTKWAIFIGIVQVLAIFVPFFKWFLSNLFSVFCRVFGQ